MRYASRIRKTDGRGGAGTGSFHPLGELALDLETFIHWASWRWIWRLSSIGRVGAGTGSFHPFGTASFYVLLLKHGNIRKISEARVFFYIFRLKPRSNRKICEKFAICKEFYTGVGVT